MKIMKTIVYLAAVFATFILTSCNSGKKANESTPQEEIKSEVQPTKDTSVPVQLKELTGYFLKNTYQFSDSIDFVVIKDKAQFDSLFGVAKTMNNTIENPDFNANTIVAILIKSTNLKTDIMLKEAKKTGDNIGVYTEITRGEKLTYTASPMVIYTFPKDDSAVNIELWINGANAKTQPAK